MGQTDLPPATPPLPGAPRKIGLRTLSHLTLLGLFLILLGIGGGFFWQTHLIQESLQNALQSHLPNLLNRQNTVSDVAALRRHAEVLHVAAEARTRQQAFSSALALCNSLFSAPDSPLKAQGDGIQGALENLHISREHGDTLLTQVHAADIQLLRAAMRAADQLNIDLFSQGKDLLAPPPTTHLRQPHNHAEGLRPVLDACAAPTAAAPACADVQRARASCAPLHVAFQEAQEDAMQLWRDLDANLRALETGASTAAAVQLNENAHFLLRHCDRLALTMIFALLALGLCWALYLHALRRFLLLPVLRISTSLQAIRDNLPAEDLPPMRIQELQELADVAPDLREYIRTINLRSRELRQEKERFVNLSLTDALTGIGNRRNFEVALNTLTLSRPLTLIMLDVDLFKSYNDLYGHQAGDDALRAVAECLQNSVLRDGDGVFRYGGEEFVLLLPDVGRDAAVGICMRIQSNIKALRIPHQGTPTNYLSLSMGVALHDSPQRPSCELLIQQADKALYQAKKLGRNRMCIYGEEGSVSPDNAGPQEAV